MKSYSEHRLLGEHVPYPIEAWPEGGQRHLSAESGLYCRIVTEGIFGIRPTGFNSFTLAPQLPDEWDYMELKNIEAFANHPFDIRVERNAAKIKTIISKNDGIVKTFTSGNGEVIKVQLTI
jgi:cellobiose phosphorylase